MDLLFIISVKLLIHIYIYIYKKKQGSKDGALWNTVFDLSPITNRNYLLIINMYCLIFVMKVGFV